MPTAVLTAEFDRLIAFGATRYSYHLRIRDDTTTLCRLLAGLDADRFVLVTDRKVPVRQVARMRAQVAAVAPCTTAAITGGEQAKTLAGVAELADAAIRAGVTRASVVIGFGGGLAGNVAGLLAALLFRGIRLVHIPTTLLAMSDSVLSLKQAVNTSDGKNQLGAFHAPQFVWANLGYTKSLPPVEVRSALCELVKNVLAIAPERYDWAAARLRPDAGYTTWELAEFTEFCVDAKQKVMAGDPRETGPGLVLEYGHTIGHAVELLTPGGLPHGLAVGAGMLAAARIAGEFGYLTASDQHAHRILLERAGAPAILPYRIPAKDVLAVLHKDNKRGYLRPQAHAVDMILLDALGSPHVDGCTCLTHVPDAAAERAITRLMPPLPARPQSVPPVLTRPSSGTSPWSRCGGRRS
jgi:3-dehydroquinate synthase/2-deoxy-scyllo-inosose synthase